ncbi:MAG: response regulator transcription factor [Thermaerobacterales bacterium]
MDSIRVVIADDHALFRQGLRRALELEGDLEVVGEGSNGFEAVTLCRDLHPDVLVLDISMPGLGGIEAARQVRAERAETGILMLTMHDGEDYLLEAVTAGIHGYVLKDVHPQELVEAVRACAGGHGYLHPAMAGKVLHKLGAVVTASLGVIARPSHSVNETGLTTREFEVLDLIAQGAGNRDIAERLFITESTVKNHVTSIFRKLGVTDRTQAALHALKRGWVKV